MRAFFPSPAVWAPKWTPLSIGADLWFDASALDTMYADLNGTAAAVDGNVQKWINRGIYNIEASALNNLPTLRESSGIYWLEFVSEFLSIPIINAKSVFVGMRRHNAIVSGPILEGACDAGSAPTLQPLAALRFSSGLGIFYASSGIALISALADVNKHVVSLSLSDTSAELWIDGTQEATGTPNTDQIATTITRFATVGDAIVSDAKPANVDIFQLVLTSDDTFTYRSDVENFVNDRMGV